MQLMKYTTITSHDSFFGDLFSLNNKNHLYVLFFFWIKITFMFISFSSWVTWFREILTSFFDMILLNRTAEYFHLSCFIFWIQSIFVFHAHTDMGIDCAERYITYRFYLAWPWHPRDRYPKNIILIFPINISRLLTKT